MTTDVVSATLHPGLARPPLRARLKLEHVVMGGAVVALIVLVVLPLLSLLFGSVKGEDGLSLDHFSEVLSGRLYLTALKNSLILGAWTSLFSLVLGLVLAWAVSRTDVPGKPLIQLTATLSYLSPPFLTAIALTYLFSPNAGLINVLMRDTAGLPWLTFNIFSMPGLVLVTVMHTFPFVYLLASSALLSVDASYEEAAQILGASKLRTALSITAPLVAPAILSGTLLAFVNALALFGSQAIIGLPARIFTLPTRIYALFDYPPEYGLASALSLVLVLITVVALYLQRAFLSRRSYVTLAGKGSRPQLMQLGALRWVMLGCRRRHLHRLDRRALCDADRGVVLEVLGARLLEGTDAGELQIHPVRLQRDATRDPQQPDAGDRRSQHRRHARRRDRLDRPAHAHPRPPLSRLCRAHPARASRHRGRGRAHPVLARHADCALRHARDPAARLCRPLHSARRARRQLLAAADRSLAGGKRPDPRRLLDDHHARDHPAADPAGPVRRLAPGIRACHSGAFGVHPAVLVQAPSPWRSRSTIFTKPAISSRSPRSP